MKRNVKALCIILSVILILIFGGCQQNPPQKIVQEKISSAYTSSAETVSTEEANHEKKHIICDETFYSTDNTVSFQFKFNANLLNSPMPVVEVAPYFLSEEDAKRVAEVLFNDATFYESEPSLSRIYSKAEILDRINRWSKYTNTTAVEELFGSPMDGVTPVVQQFISDFTLLYETAPEDNPHRLCDWKYKKALQYVYTEEYLNEEKLDLSDDNKKISASVSKNDIDYQYNVVTRDMRDFKLSSISAYTYSGLSPYDIDSLIIRSQLCRTEKPSDSQVEYVTQLADSLLKEMNLGTWEIDQRKVQASSLGNTTEYVISIDAVPVFNGTAATRHIQLENLKSKTEYSSNYFLTDAHWEFSPNGDLIRFEMESPIEIKNVLTEDAETLEVTALIERAKEYFYLTDYYEYGFASGIEQNSTDIGCNVVVSMVEDGLTRIKVPNSDDRYYYVPSITFRGSIEYFIKESGEICFNKDDAELLVLNAIDGTIIQTSNE